MDTPNMAQKSPNQTQTANTEQDGTDEEVVEKIWLPLRDSNPDMPLQRRLSYR